MLADSALAAGAKGSSLKGVWVSPPSAHHTWLASGEEGEQGAHYSIKTAWIAFVFWVLSAGFWGCSAGLHTGLVMFHLVRVGALLKAGEI